MDELKEQIEVFGERLPLGEMLQRIAGGGMKTLERVMAAERRVAEFQQGGKCLIALIERQHDDIETIKRVLGAILPDAVAELQHERLPDGVRQQREIEELRKLFNDGR